MVSYGPSGTGTGTGTFTARPAIQGHALVAALAESALHDALGALQIGAPEGVPGPRELEHGSQLVADEERNHRYRAGAALAAREAHRQRVFGWPVGRTEHGATKAGCNQQQV